MPTQRELLALREDNRAKFLEFWGDDFVSMEIKAHWVQASKSGNHVAFCFVVYDDQEVRLTLPLGLLTEFMGNLTLAMDRIALIKAATEPETPAN